LGILLLVSRNFERRASESLVLALKERVETGTSLRKLATTFGVSLPGTSEARSARVKEKQTLDVDAALDEMIARYQKTLDYLAK
jgi:hypothetical protein